MDRSETSRALFLAGAKVKAVLAQHDISQRQVADAAGYPAAHISAVIRGQPGAIGLRKQIEILRIVAGLVGVGLEDIPEARALKEKEAARVKRTS